VQQPQGRHRPHGRRGCLATAWHHVFTGIGTGTSTGTRSCIAHWGPTSTRGSKAVPTHTHIVRGRVPALLLGRRHQGPRLGHWGHTTSQETRALGARGCLRGTGTSRGWQATWGRGDRASSQTCEAGRLGCRGSGWARATTQHEAATDGDGTRAHAPEQTHTRTQKHYKTS
jgi:hypothetical protein